nr:tRNA lysidine(34) synthetase TilS [Microlunatus panaciterrae]
MQVVQAVAGAIEAEGVAGPLLVACSGGADSLALAAGARRVADRTGLGCAAVVVDHDLQPGSAAVAGSAAQALAELGYTDVEVVRVSVADSAVGPEAAARQARYQALDRLAGCRDAHILLGHTLDDQAETVLLGLVRGSGTRSLAGMAAVSGRYLRPLLQLRRADTVRACAELGLHPWQDPHNRDTAFTRSRLRTRVLPVLERELGPGIAEALARTAQLARDDADLLDSLAAVAHPAADTLDCAVLGGQPPSLRRRAIRSWLSDRGAPEVGFVHVVAVEALVVDWHGQRGVDVPGARVVRDAGRLRCVAG